MARSMTGFGRSEQIVNGQRITVELKSVNHRYFELSTRMPRMCNFMEDKLRNLLQSGVSRGKVDLSISIARLEGSSATVRADTDLAKAYLAALRQIAEETGVECRADAATLARFPDVLVTESAQVDPDRLWADVEPVVREALAGFIAMRETEGAKMKADVLEKLGEIERLAAVVEERSPKTLEAYRARLYQKISEVLGDRTVDEGRMLTEVAVFADRIAVDEETVRLHSHIAQYRDILSQDGPIGRKLDFLTQELNREANTIGSKSQSAEIAAVVVQLKSDVEKIREQIQNIE